jgi:hypothetical protein
MTDPKLSVDAAGNLTKEAIDQLLLDPAYQAEMFAATERMVLEHMRTCPGCADLVAKIANPRKHPIKPIETKDADKVPKPTDADFKNGQIDLFQGFLCNTPADRDRLSNAIDLWDNVPRYSVSRQEMTKVRINGLFLQSRQIDFKYKDRAMTVTLNPARVQDGDGISRDFYASANEEIVEDALRKLATEQQAGYYAGPDRSGVTFTIYALQQELKKRGHARSYGEIVLSLNILSGSIIEISSRDPDKRGEFTTRSAYLPYLSAVSRSGYLEDPDTQWAVQFHPLVTRMMDAVRYRQFDYHEMMGYRTQLARWLHKQLALKYTFADNQTPFVMLYSTIKRDSGLLDSYARERAAIEAVDDAFAELQGRTLSSVMKENQTGKRKKILDVKYTLRPTEEFVRDTKASNKRSLDQRAASARLSSKNI